MQIPALRRKHPRSLSKRLTSRAPGKPASALCDTLKEYLSDDAVDEVYKAYLFGAEAHAGQRRLSGEPYIHHPVAVAEILTELKLDHRSIIAAILHDVIEDTPTAKEELEAEFGPEVALLVDGVSKIGQIDFESKEHAEAENFRKMLMAMAQDIRVILIKLADRLHNMRTLDALPLHKRRRVARQTMDIYAPIANRLGLYQWSRELQDLSFRNLYPKRYTAIEKGIRKRQGNRKSVIKKLQSAIEAELHQSGIQAEVVGRRKNVYSIYKKMVLKRKSFRELQDIYGFRIIIDTPDDCYRVLGVVHNLFKPIPGRFRDYIAIPKANGYQSLHTVVFGAFGESLEVQIRTVDMNRIAEAGIASHWIYKSESRTGVKAQELARQWLLDLLDTQKQSGNPSEFLEHLKIDLFPDEVYVFTHQGDIKKLPRGATALDFAYAVHTDVGNQCAGVRVNRELVSLPTVLHNGDHVEIITSSSARPTPSWLNYTATGKARASIRHYLKKLQGREAVKLGKRLLDHAIKTSRFGRTRLTTQVKKDVLSNLGVENWDNLLEDIGLGKRLPVMVANQILLKKRGGDGASLSEAQEIPLAIDGAEGMLITFARCCSPVPGDNIVGFMTAGRGVVVHMFDCPNIAEYRKHPDKWVHVNWADEVQGVYSVNVRVDTENKRGVLANVATAIAEQGSNINNVNVEERDGRFSTIRFSIEVKDRINLAHILKSVRHVQGVLRVARAKG
jgi:guanosine-3',5'-bis(diphosphate) 3'-pyrophosphohydrolase